ncbi:MAG: transporter substrate-binding domain-containing protein [Balneolaceae bacterium]
MTYLRTLFALVCLSLILFHLNAADLHAQTEPTDTETVAIRIVPPFVIEEPDGSYSGLTIFLWEQIAEEMDINTRYEKESIQGMIDGVANGRYLAAASALTITSERERMVDFSHPFYITGLGIAVPDKPAGLFGAIRALFSADLWWSLILLLGLLLFWGVLVWVFERQENREEFGGSAAEGIGSGFWWAAVTMTTVGYGDKSPRTLGGRIIGFIWMFTAVIVISFFTASIASSLTINQLDSRVSSADDLPNARVGVLENSATILYMEAEDIPVRTFGSIEEGLQAVVDDRLDAFLHDAPILAYQIQQHHRGRLRLLPDTVEEQYYGIALQPNSPLRNQINTVLLDVIRSDAWQAQLQQYIGK